MTHGGRIRGLLAAAVLLGACERKPGPASAAAAAQTTSAAIDLPVSREGFLAELVPRPRQPVLVVYGVKGPAETAGSLTLVIKAGGFRREDWTIRVPVPGQDAVEVVGTTVQTPDRIWSGTADEPGELASSPLGELADGYLALDAGRKAKVLASVRGWHDDLRSARVEHPGDVEEVLGVRCLVLEVAAQTLCLWEELGIPLRYAGGAFTLEATKIEREPEVDEGLFELPVRAKDARAAGPRRDLSAAESLERLAAGDYGPLALLLQLGLELPLPQGE